MTQYTSGRPDAEIARESRTPVRLPAQMSAPIFQGWGPKF
jgi:hypothetical protein